MQNFIGFILPPLIDLINRKIEDADYRFWVSVIVCTLVGTVLSVLEAQGVSAEDIAMKSMAMFGMAQLTYRGTGYKGSQLQDTMKGNS